MGNLPISVTARTQLLQLHKVTASQCRVTVENNFCDAKVTELSRPTVLADLPSTLLLYKGTAV